MDQDNTIHNQGAENDATASTNTPHSPYENAAAHPLTDGTSATEIPSDSSQPAQKLDISSLIAKTHDDISVHISLSQAQAGTLAYQLGGGGEGIDYSYDNASETLTLHGDAARIHATLATLVFIPNSANTEHFSLMVEVESGNHSFSQKVAMLYDGAISKHVAVFSPSVSSGSSAVIRRDLVELTIAEYGEIDALPRMRLKRLRDIDKAEGLGDDAGGDTQEADANTQGSEATEELFYETEPALFQFAVDTPVAKSETPASDKAGNRSSSSAREDTRNEDVQPVSLSNNAFTVTDEASIDRSSYITGLDASVTLLENTINAGAVRLDNNVSLAFDTKYGLNGATVRVGYDSGSPGLAQDQLTILDAGSITVAGSAIIWNGSTTFATIIGNGSNGSDLHIRFNANAQGFMAEELLESLAYQNTSDTPVTTRTLVIEAHDGQGNAPALARIEVRITPEADPLTHTLTPGVDNLTAQFTDDTFTGANADFQAADVLIGDTGTDSLIFTDAVNGALGDWANKTGIEEIILNANGNIITLSDAFVDASDTDSVVINNQTFTLTLNTDDLNNARDAIIGGTGLVTMANVRNRVLVADTVDGNVQGGSNRDTIIAGDGDDSIRGGSNHDSIIGGGGNDTLNGENNNDTLRGGLGNDTIIDDHGHDRHFGDEGDDYISSGRNNDILYGGIGNDTLDAGNDADSLWGQEGDDSMRGGNHNDTLYGGAGADTLRGDGGTDMYVYKAMDESTSAEMDIIEDFVVTVEKLIFSGLALKYLADSAFSGVADQLRWYQSGGNTFVEADTDGDTNTDFILRLNGTINLSIDQFVGVTDQSGDDTLMLTVNANDVITGTGGTDTITTTNANFHLGDSINAQGDMDTLIFSDAANFSQADLANKTNIERIELNANGNVVGISYAFVNTALNRDFFLDNQNFTVVELDASGLNNTRQLYIEGSGLITLKDGVNNYLYYSAGVTANMDGGTGNDRIFTSTTGNMHDIIDGGDGDDSIRTYSGNDSIRGGLGNDSLLSDNGNDTVYGGDGDDRIIAGNNHDLVYGEDGDDSLHGGRNNDTVYGGDGDDTIYGDGEVDLLYGDAGNDSINAFTHNDTVFGGDGNDTIYGHNNNDSLFGEADDDYIDGGRHNDTLYGGDGNDTLYGEREHDRLFGGDGNDSLHGHNNDDWLYGGDGVDTLTGGNNTDRYVFEAASESGIGAGNRDIITDFSSGQSDKIVLTSFAFAGNSAFIGNAAFADDGTLEVRYSVSGTDAVLELNLDGVGGTDFEIELTGIDGTTLLAGDFIW